MIAFANFVSRYLYVIPIIILIYVWSGRTPLTRWLIFMRVITISLVAGILVFVSDKYLVGAKPYIYHAITNITKHPIVPGSFPSHHTILTYSSALLVLPFSLPWGILSLIIAVLISASRIAIQLHFAIGVWGGMLVALLGNIVALLLFPGDKKINS